jgi:hypothetical protein
MDSRTFFHHFYAPPEQHPESFWGERLPWKLGDSLLPKEQGWGIHLEEQPNWSLFALYMAMLMLLSGLVAILYSLKTGDSQTAVAIGAWLTTVQGMLMTAVFFWSR